MPVTLDCEQCGRSFSVPPCRATRAHYCSPACKKASQITQVERACPSCGRTFWVAHCHLERIHYCSRACKNAVCFPQVEHACEHCGTVFPMAPSRKERTHYCSRACRNAARSHRQERACACCGKTFTRRASNPARYCSDACGHAARRAPVRPVEIEASAIAAYERLVFSVANQMYSVLHPDSMTIEDFVQEGMIGLLTAIQHKKETDDPRPLTGFAYVHIRMAILDAYRTQDHMIRLPVSLFRKDATVTPEELARVKSLARHLSIESYAERRDGTPLVTHRRVSSASPVERVVLARERMEELLRGLMCLPELQRSLLVSHFGVVGEPIPMLHLSRQTGIAPSSLCRLVHHALEQLRHQSLAEETPCSAQ